MGEPFDVIATGRLGVDIYPRRIGVEAVLDAD